MTETKETLIIQAKINTKKEQIKGVSYIGPGIIIILGFPALLLYVIPGLILLGFGAWWATKRQNEIIKLENEIKELVAAQD